MVGTPAISLYAVNLSPSCAAILAVVLSHARRVEFPVLIERVALAVGLGAASIIIFVDGLGLTMKSMFVMDLWTAFKTIIIKPLFR